MLSAACCSSTVDRHVTMSSPGVTLLAAEVRECTRPDGVDLDATGCQHCGRASRRVVGLFEYPACRSGIPEFSAAGPGRPVKLPFGDRRRHSRPDEETSSNRRDRARRVANVNRSARRAGPAHLPPFAPLPTTKGQVRTVIVTGRKRRLPAPLREAPSASLVRGSGSIDAGQSASSARCDVATSFPQPVTTR